MCVNYHIALKRGNQLAINQRLGFNLTRYFTESFAAATHKRCMSLSQNYNNKFARNTTGVANAAAGFLLRRLIEIARSQFFLRKFHCVCTLKRDGSTTRCGSNFSRGESPDADRRYENRESIFAGCSTKVRAFLQRDINKLLQTAMNTVLYGGRFNVHLGRNYFRFY